MDDLLDKAQQLESDIAATMFRLKIPETKKRLFELQGESEKEGFWTDNLRAQSTMKEIANMDNRQKPWTWLYDEVSDLVELIKSGDKTLEPELLKKLDQIKSKFENSKAELKFDGPFDDHDAIVSLYAGAGGTDAQDWTQMLLRMYTRWAENNSLKIKTVDESPGEEAGLKGVTIEIDGEFVYGKLKGEHGVHRLVRLSPFNADHLRQTSFAKVEVLPKIDRLGELELDDKDLKIDVYRSGGHGGQSVNTTDSAVRVTHAPTGINVAIQNERSQLQNKETALTILRSKLARLQLEQHQKKLEAIKGPNQSAEWGNQIRSYVLHPYKQVKDLRTKYETSDVNGVLDGDLDGLINAYLEYEVPRD